MKNSNNQLRFSENKKLKNKLYSLNKTKINIENIIKILIENINPECEYPVLKLKEKIDIFHRDFDIFETEIKKDNQ